MPTTLRTTLRSKPFGAGLTGTNAIGQGVQASGLHALPFCGLPFFCHFRERVARLGRLCCGLNMGETAMKKLAFLFAGAAALALTACNNTDADDADDGDADTTIVESEAPAPAATVTESTTTVIEDDDADDADVDVEADVDNDGDTDVSAEID